MNQQFHFSSNSQGKENNNQTENPISDQITKKNSHWKCKLKLSPNVIPLLIRLELINLRSLAS